MNGNIAISQIDHWETAVYEYDIWQYLVPTEAVDETWNTIDFDAGAWPTGPGGFGYGDGDDNTVVPSGTLTIFQRIQFTITDKDAIDAAALTIDFDDAFIAYLNGTEIRRSNLVGAGQPAWNQEASALHEADLYGGTYPNQFTLTKEFLDENLIEGENILAVQAHNESIWSSDLSSRAYFHLGINNTSTDYSPLTDWFIPPVILDQSNLPIIIINTVDGDDVLDEPKTAGIMGIINNVDSINSVNDPFNEFYGEIGIELRGSSSGMFPKKAYGLETRGPDSSNYNVSIFDWPVDNDWILYAPYSDKSLIRNVLTYKLGNEMGNYAPRTKLCEVVLNGEYIGVYVFMERIKQNPGRVDIDELLPEDLKDNELTGGYIVKIDKTTGGGIPVWTSPFPQAAPATGPVRYQLHDPEIDAIHPLQVAYIQNYITSFETALSGPDFADPVDGYLPYIDLLSFVDFMIVNEISKNVDGYRISTFLHKERQSDGGKLVAGPLWDFNLAWGNANYCAGGNTTGWEIYFNNVCGGGGPLNNPFWWNRFVEDENFTHTLNCRWQELRLTNLSNEAILGFIDEMEVYLADAAERNFTRWPILGTYVWPNNFEGETYEEEMEYLREWTVTRLEWLDENMFGSCEDLGFGEDQTMVMSAYPNPSEGIISIKFSQLITDGNITVTNQMGQVIHSEIIQNQSELKLDLSANAPSIYFIQLFDENALISTKKIILK